MLTGSGRIFRTGRSCPARGKGGSKSFRLGRPDTAAKGLSLAAGLLIFSWAVVPPLTAAVPDENRLYCEHQAVQWPVQAFFVLPGQVVHLEPGTARPSASICFSPPQGELRGLPSRGWSWKAPAKAGLYSAAYLETPRSSPLILNFFVMVPFGALKRGYVGGYRIGVYPEQTVSKYSHLKPIRGFVEVTKENQGTRLTPHFTLGQFLCKQTGGFPKYLVLDERLPAKLERLQELILARDPAKPRLEIMSGYRTPAYNHRLGNAAHSAHLYGQAADVCLSAPNQPRALKAGKRMIQTLYQIVEEMDLDFGEPAWAGGLGYYPAGPEHPAFLHVDVRGMHARWGEKPSRYARLPVRQ